MTSSAPEAVSQSPASRSSMGGVHDDLGPGPSAAVVEGAGEFDAAEGADVVFATAGVGGEEFAGAAAEECRPGVVEAGLMGAG